MAPHAYEWRPVWITYAGSLYSLGFSLSKREARNVHETNSVKLR